MFQDVKRFKVGIKGVTPLIMHSIDGANPQNEITMAIAELTLKKKKTEHSQKAISDLDFKRSLYWSDSLNGLYMPTDNLRKMVLEAGRSMDQRGAKKQVVGVTFSEYLGYPFQVKNRDNLDLLMSDESIRYFKIVTIGRARVPRVRAIFRSWSLDFSIDIDCSIINPSTVEGWLVYAGGRVGLGSRRPYAPTPGEFGKFIVEEFKEI